MNIISIDQHTTPFDVFNVLCYFIDSLQSIIAGMCRLSSFNLDDVFKDCYKDFNIIKKRNSKPELLITKADLCQ